MNENSTIVTQSRNPLVASSANVLNGNTPVPGDKSISHRALIFGALARGNTEINGLLESEDVLMTAKAIAALGAIISRRQDGHYTVSGTGRGGMRDPETALDLGNSGTGARLLMGLIAGQGLTATFVGDDSLQSRPMKRILDPLKQMGAIILEAAPGDRLPMTIEGTVPAIPIDYSLPVPSAQVKSAVLIAGLGAFGHTIVREHEPTRDHTERMLQYFGADISVQDDGEGRIITVQGEADLIGNIIEVPGDPSSAAFPLVAALITPESEICVENAMINPTRTGLYTTLREMGANLTFENERDASGEPVADIRAVYGSLRGIEVPAARVPSMIDEYPILAVVAAFAEGTTIMRGLGELRVKESDRLQAILSGLQLNGVDAFIENDDLIVQGGAGLVAGGGLVETHLDHRIAMSFLVMGLASQNPVTIDDHLTINTSFPGFRDLMASLGAQLDEA